MSSTLCMDLLLYGSCSSFVWIISKLLSMSLQETESGSDKKKKYVFKIPPSYWVLSDSRINIRIRTDHLTCAFSTSI